MHYIINKKFFKALCKPFIALLAGALLTLAFAPYQLYLLGYLCPAVLLALWLNSTPKQAFVEGALFGLGFFSTGVYWIYISIYVHGNTALPLALLLTSLFIIVMALFSAFQGFLLQRCFRTLSLYKILLVFPASWVLLEWVRSWFLTGFPWLNIGYTQINAPLRGLAPLIGIYGVSFCTLLVSALLVVFVYANVRQKVLSLGSLIILLISSALLSTIVWTQPQQSLTVSLIQGNIKQTIKWQPDSMAEIIKTYYNLTLPELGQDLIIWPESAFPIPSWAVKDEIDNLDKHSKDHKSALIIGVPQQAHDDSHFYNTMIGVGEAKGSYLKRHLVPFGEYVPFDQYVRGWIQFFNLPMSSFIPGQLKENLIAQGVLIAPTICYEIAYPHLVLQNLPMAQLLLTISDDSWFGNSNASHQHLEMGQMRALETGRYLLFATNDGITAIVNPRGDIVAKIPQFESGVLNGKVYAMNGVTPFISYGSTPVLLLLSIAFGYGYLRKEKMT